MMSQKLIVCIVPRDSGGFINNVAVSAGALGGTILMGRGTASSNILQLLGFGDSAKDIYLGVVSESIASKVKNAIIDASKDKKSPFGVLFTVDVGQLLKAGSMNNIFEQGENADMSIIDKNDMEETKLENTDSEKYEMINIIVNKGYAEDAMAAARKAGASGGTIINARGTAKEGDAKFFGMDIVPEKEMLLIVVPESKKNDIVSAVSGLECFSKAGSGIIFCNQANDFTVMGKKKV
ncbi:MAG: transcriptional regulator [Treponema sp.]|nr:transcriptional regulator [Treponema sp.]